MGSIRTTRLTLSTPLRRSIAILALAALVAVPLLVALAFGADGVQTSLVLGPIVGVTARLLGSPRVGMAAIPSAALLSFIVACASASPLAVGVVFAIAGVVVGLAARSGLARAIMNVPIAAGFAVDPATAIGEAAVDAAFLAIGGAWAFAVVDMLARRTLIPSFPRREPIAPADALIYAGALGAAAGIGNGIVAALEVPHGAWVNLTLFIVAVPTTRDTVRKVVERCVGTVIGAALAIAIAHTLPWPTVWQVIAVLLIAPMVMTMHRHYWVYAIFLTMVILFMESESDDALVDADVYRVGLTLATSAAVLVLALALHATVISLRSSTDMDYTTSRR